MSLWKEYLNFWRKAVIWFQVRKYLAILFWVEREKVRIYGKSMVGSICQMQNLEQNRLSSVIILCLRFSQTQDLLCSFFMRHKEDVHSVHTREICANLPQNNSEISPTSLWNSRSMSRKTNIGKKNKNKTDQYPTSVRYVFPASVYRKNFGNYPEILSRMKNPKAKCIC